LGAHTNALANCNFECIVTHFLRTPAHDAPFQTAFWPTLRWSTRFETPFPAEGDANAANTHSPGDAEYLNTSESIFNCIFNQSKKTLRQCDRDLHFSNTVRPF